MNKSQRHKAKGILRGRSLSDEGTLAQQILTAYNITVQQVWGAIKNKPPNHFWIYVFDTIEEKGLAVKQVQPQYLGDVASPETQPKTGDSQSHGQDVIIANLGADGNASDLNLNPNEPAKQDPINTNTSKSNGSFPPFQPTKQRTYYETYGTRNATRPIDRINVVFAQSSKGDLQPPSLDEHSVQQTRDLHHNSAGMSLALYPLR